MDALEISTNSSLETLETESLINEFEAGLAALGDEVKVDLPLKHTFTPGLYLRQIFMPAGAVVVSRRHLTEHPFIVLTGSTDVFDEQGGYLARIVAPYVGVTPPGTRRVLYIIEDCVWLTAHATDLTDPDEIVETITSHENPLFPKDYVSPCFEKKGRIEQ
jgi:hypothetical protein